MSGPTPYRVALKWIEQTPGNGGAAGQVRRPINRQGVEHWLNYEPWPGPLRAAPGELAPTATGGNAG
jgi:hypothetical protein